MTDLTIRKSGPGALSVGQTASFTLTVTNHGPAAVAAGDVQISDTLPSAFAAPVQAGGPGWTCQVSGLAVVCTYVGAPVGPGAVLPPITVSARAATAGGFVQCASVRPSRFEDPKPADNRACLDGRITAGPKDVSDVGVSKRVSGPVASGQAATFVVTAYNVGPSAVSASSGAQIVDLLPPGFTGPVLASGPGWICTVAGLTVTCTYGGPAVSAGGAFTPVTISAIARGKESYVNCAIVSLTRATDANLGNNRSCVRGEVRPPTGRHDLRIRKTGPASLTVGQMASFTLTPYNLGPSSVTAADAVTVTDTLPVIFAQVQAAGAGWTCTVSSGSPAMVSCHYVGPPVGANAPLPPIMIVGTARTDGPFVNCARIARRAGPDANLGDNRGCTEGRVQPEGKGFDIGITKRVRGRVIGGQQATFVLNPYNTGTATVNAASGVRVTDTLPPTFTMVQAAGSGWTCTVGGAGPYTVSCGYVGPPVVANSALPPITVSALARTAGAFVNCAEIDLKVARDLSPRDNRGCTDGKVTARPLESGPDVALVKTALEGPWSWPNGTGVYRFGVTNTGNVTIPAGYTFQVTESLPAGMVLVGAPSDCAPGAGTPGPAQVTCTFFSNWAFPPGATTTFHLKVGFQGGKRPAYTNCAQVRVHSGGRPWAEADFANNRDCEPVVVNASWPFDVGIDKGGPSNLSIGQSASYVLTPVNAGQPLNLNPPPANPPPSVSVYQTVVQVTDTLPPMFSPPVTVNGGAAWTCAVANLTVTCTYVGGGIIAPGGSLPPITITATARQPGSAEQCAVVTIGGAFFIGDPAPANNRDCVTVSVSPAPSQGDVKLR